MNTTTPNRLPTSRILRLPDVINRTLLRRTMIYQLEALGDFPTKLKLGCRAVGWVESEVDAWLKARANSRRVRTPVNRKDRSMAA
jgi:prophage regulatory protein